MVSHATCRKQSSFSNGKRMSSVTSSLFEASASGSSGISEQAATLSAYRRELSIAALLEEPTAVRELLAVANPSHASDSRILELAERLVQAVRTQRRQGAGVDALMQGFPLSSPEGLALMGLAEALLRVPDASTANSLIADKLGTGRWAEHAQHATSPWVKAAAYSLSLASRLTAAEKMGSASSFTTPVMRHVANAAMRQLGEQFVCGQTIEDALRNSRVRIQQGYRYSYDMLGEAALTAEDAEHYYKAYETALHEIGREAQERGIHDSPGISVKLSALHPRYTHWQHRRIMEELVPRLKQLLVLAKRYGIGLNIDAEEADRLEMSLDVIEALAFDHDLDGFDGMGIVVQAYQKRCLPLIDYLIELAHRSKRRFMVRLVKGAYWDSEIKRAQVEGLLTYPVYTRKAHTDVSYLVCAQKLLSAHEVLYPQFATHNAHTVATLIHWAKEQNVTRYEFQCLYGMGEALYDQVVGKNELDKPCRIYAPVGSHSTLLAYLVRRLLENGANSSFVNQLLDESLPIESLLTDPFALSRQTEGEPHPAIPLPAHLFGNERINSRGLDLSNREVMQSLQHALQVFADTQWRAEPSISKGVRSGQAQPVSNPANHKDIVGQVSEAEEGHVDQALAMATSFAKEWQAWPVEKRAVCLRRAADLFEAHRAELMALAIREAGKTLSNAIGEVREAVDFLRYYAAQAESLPPASALGPIACISPWNFPLAIFTGQVSAALAVGNVVLAKPAEQTPLIAHRAVTLLHEAGVPLGALQFLPGQGETVGEKLVRDERVRGVVFTGSTDVARRIHGLLVQRSAKEGGEIPLLAETGGQNVMIVDASALPEQVVQDVLISAFDSAGQRCSALRVLCLQEEIADRTIGMLKGAMLELCIGNPAFVSTDVGPVIDTAARKSLQAHIDTLRSRGHPVFQLPLEASHADGTFVAPALIEIQAISQVTREVFGPVLHVLRYQRKDLPELMKAVHATGYGLTMGVQSRIATTVDLVAEHAKVGNLYVNRNMIGAVVGVQPFGGEGLSGTGPKAGGPLYLRRLIKEGGQARFSTLELRQSAGKESRAFTGMLEWCQECHPDLYALGRQYGDNSLLHGEIDLPGPTGETNILRFVPRGTVLCAAATRHGLLHQLIVALASGNRIALFSQTGQYLPSDLPPCVLEVFHAVSKTAESGVDAVLADASLVSDMRLLMAEKAGPTVPVIEVRPDQAVSLWRLFHERTLCINTTAAGGNASLVMLRP
jgi:RHH-type proline utilization regulon transcriptional repressor/proline dehydrogenase/delta 1-pyrroline-5-carboxylate dehydrogenase